MYDIKILIIKKLESHEFKLEYKKDNYKFEDGLIFTSLYINFQESIVEASQESQDLWPKY